MSFSVSFLVTFLCASILFSTFQTPLMFFLLKPNFMKQVILEKLIVLQMVKKLCTSYGSWNYHIYKSPSLNPSWIQSTPSYPIIWSSFHLGLYFSSALFLSGFLLQMLHEFLNLIMHATCLTHSILLTFGYFTFCLLASNSVCCIARVKAPLVHTAQKNGYSSNEKHHNAPTGIWLSAISLEMSHFTDWHTGAHM